MDLMALEARDRVLPAIAGKPFACDGKDTPPRTLPAQVLPTVFSRVPDGLIAALRDADRMRISFVRCGAIRL